MTVLLPPEEYLRHCDIPKDDVTVGGTILRLAALVECERRGKDALRAWRDRMDRRYGSTIPAQGGWR